MRTATAARCTGRCSRPPASHTSKLWRPSGTMPGRWPVPHQGPIRDDRARSGCTSAPRSPVRRRHSSATVTIPSSAKPRCVEPRVARHGSAGSPSSGTRIRRAMCLDLTTPSPCQVRSRSTDVTASPNLSLSASARLDVHSEYGTFFSPRVSALARAGRWTSRLSVGTGFFGPTPITEETEAAGLTRLAVRRR